MSQPSKQFILLDYVTTQGGFFKHSSYIDIYAGILDQLQLPYQAQLLHINPFDIQNDLDYYEKNFLSADSEYIIYFRNPWLRNEIFSLRNRRYDSEQEDAGIFFLQSQKKNSDEKSWQRIRTEKNAGIVTTEQIKFFVEFDLASFCQTLREFGFVIDSQNELKLKEIDFARGQLINASRKIIFPERSITTDSIRYFMGGVPSCGYTTTVLNNDNFRDIDMPEGIRLKKGCSFCRLDPLPQKSDRDFSQDIASATIQFTQTLTTNPSIGGFISEDQLFLNYFEEIIQNLKKGGFTSKPIEFYLVSRAVYINNFEEKIRTLLQYLVATNFKLIFHLVGFENFSQRQLDIFNKGAKVKTLLNCLEVLLQLERDFPQNFMARTGSHGYILFTPWLSFDELLENTRITNQYHFQNFSGHFHLRKLRISKDVPLYYKALQEGLVDEENAASTAQYHAYEGDVPWRFIDEDVNLVFKLNHRYHYFSTLEKKEILNSSSLTVDNHRRNPNFCHFDPKIACDFSRQCLISANVLPPSNSLHNIQIIIDKLKNVSDLEKISLDLELRTLVKFEGSPQRSILEYTDAIKKLYSHYLIKFYENTEGRLNGPIFIAKDADLLNVAIALEQNLRHNVEYSKSARKMGELLGYPSCCINQYTAQYSYTDRERHNDTATRIQLMTKKNEFACPLISYLNTLLSYFPCSLDCRKSIAKSQKILNAFLNELVDSEGRQNLMFALNRKLLYFNEDKFIFFFGDLFLPESKIIFSEASGFSPEEKMKLRRANFFHISEIGFQFYFDSEQLLSFPKQEAFLLVPGERSLDQLNAFNNQKFLTANTRLIDLSNSLKNTDYIIENFDQIIIKKDKIEFTDTKNNFTIFLMTPNSEPAFFKNDFIQISYKGQQLSPHQNILLTKVIDASLIAFK